jgi:hypothetical protein
MFVLNGTYEPKPMRRVEIPKPDAGARKFSAGIDSSRQAVMQVQGERGEECGGATPGAEVSRIQLYGGSRGQARDCAEGSGSVQATSPGDHATGKGRQHGDDDRGPGSVYTGLAQLLRLPRNARSADLPYPLGPAATQGSAVGLSNAYFKSLGLPSLFEEMPT